MTRTLRLAFNSAPRAFLPWAIAGGPLHAVGHPLDAGALADVAPAPGLVGVRVSSLCTCAVGPQRFNCRLPLAGALLDLPGPQNP